MLELIVAAAAVIAALALSVATGRRRKREGLAWTEAQPQDVARLYLRAADTDAYWLHAQMRNGKKRMIAAPWELDDILGRLAAHGVTLSDDDRAKLDASISRARDEGGQAKRRDVPGDDAAV